MTVSTQVTGGLTALSLWCDSQLQEAIMKDPTVHAGVYNGLHITVTTNITTNGSDGTILGGVGHSKGVALGIAG